MRNRCLKFFKVWELIFFFAKKLFFWQKNILPKISGNIVRAVSGWFEDALSEFQRFRGGNVGNCHFLDFPLKLSCFFATIFRTRSSSWTSVKNKEFRKHYFGPGFRKNSLRTVLRFFQKSFHSTQSKIILCENFSIFQGRISHVFFLLEKKIFSYEKHVQGVS